MVGTEDRCTEVERIYFRGQCTKERTHIFGDTAEERLHEFEIKPGDTLRWGSTADVAKAYPYPEDDD